MPNPIANLEDIAGFANNAKSIFANPTEDKLRELQENASSLEEEAYKELKKISEKYGPNSQEHQSALATAHAYLAIRQDADELLAKLVNGKKNHANGREEKNNWRDGFGYCPHCNGLTATIYNIPQGAVARICNCI